MKNAIIFDIDGTLADLTHRRHLVTGHGKPDWKTFMDKMVDDPPLADMCWLAELLGDHPLVDSGQLSLFLFSGRSETHRKETETWLSSNVPEYFKARTALFMRGEGDFRADTLIKKDMLREVQARGHTICIVFMLDSRDAMGLQCFPKYELLGGAE